MTVVGYRRADFRGSDGHMVEGYRVYLSYEISPNQGAGLATDYVYMTTARLANMGVDVDVIAGFRSKDIVILEDEYKEVCNRLFITTDDGTYGEKGFVTNKLQDLIDAGNNYDLVIAIGPIPMMKFVSKVTEPY